ncbi:MAG: MOSC domain-containing protein [Chloroflexi bacterium]|nr:MOSC domain-containing protein [Chloroflexota bacterium]
MSRNVTVVSEDKTKGGSTPVRTGTVVAVAYSRELINGVGKETHDTAQITRWGIPGDRHYGETRVSRGHVVPNNRPITVVGVEGVREACKRLGVQEIPYGGMGENLLFEGLGDLGDLEAGDELHLFATDGTPGAVLQVRKQNEPCSSLMVYHKQMPKELYGKRGVLCMVLQEGSVSTGDRVDVRRGSKG